MMRDRRRPWQKRAQAYPWAKDGACLAETERALSAMPEPSVAILPYASALGISVDEAKRRIAAQEERLK